MDGGSAGEASDSSCMDEADEDTGEAVGVDGADGYDCRRSTNAVDTSEGKARLEQSAAQEHRRLTFHEEYTQQRPKPENGQNHERRAQSCKGTHTIIPAQRPTSRASFAAGLRSALNASCRRCANAVARMTPVPKCFPTKKSTLGTRTARNAAVSVGNETAAVHACGVSKHNKNARQRRG